MKGIELPINILVIVAIAVIVLLGMVALYFAGWSPFSQTAGIEAVKNSACVGYTRNNQCLDDPATVTITFDVGGDGDATNDNLQDFADMYYNCGGNPNCARRLCACPGY